MLNESGICSHLFVIRQPTGFPCTHQVADLRVCGFMSSVCPIRSITTYFNITSFPPWSILRSHFTHQSRDRILRDSDGRTWSWPLANLVDRNPRPGYGFQSEHLPLRKAGNMVFQLGWFEHVVHSIRYLQTRDTPLPLGVSGCQTTQQSRKACRNDQTGSLLSRTHCQPNFRYESRSQPLLLTEYAYVHCLSVVSTVLGSTPALHVYVSASSLGDHCPE